MIILKRGNVVLTQIKTINKNKIFKTKNKVLPKKKNEVQPPKKIIVVKTHVIINQFNKLQKKTIIGAKTNIILFDLLGNIVSLRNNFNHLLKVALNQIIQQD